MPTRGTGRRTLAAPALLLAVAMTLTGCTDGGNSTPTPTPTVTPTPSPTPSPTPQVPTPPTRPEAMATNDEAGAVAAAEFFMVELYDYMFATGDSTQWAALADDGCNFCNSMLGIVEEMNAASETETSDPTIVESSEVSTLIDGSRFGVTLVAQQGSSTRLDSSGDVVSTSEGGRYSLNFALAWTGDWSILALDATPMDEAQ